MDIYEYQRLIFLFNLHKDDDLEELASYKKDKVWKEKEQEKGMEFDESVATIESNDSDYNEDGNKFIANQNKRTAEEHAKIREKKKHRKQLNNFIAELEIPCYFIMNKKNKKELKAEKKRLIKLTRLYYGEAALAIVCSSCEGDSEGCDLSSQISFERVQQKQRK